MIGEFKKLNGVKRERLLVMVVDEFEEAEILG